MKHDAEPGRADIFVSYKSEDRKRVEEICKVLEDRGITLWRDVNGINGGEFWAEKVSPVINRCKVVLLMCSELSLRSRDVRNEVVFSQNLEKPLIPLHLDEDLQYPPGWDLVLGALQTIKILNRPATEWLPALLKTLRQHRVGMRAPHRPPDGLMSTTVTWLEKLRDAVKTLPEAALHDLQSPGLALTRSATESVAYLKDVDDELPQLYQILVASARGEKLAAEEAKALRELQAALVDLARIVVFAKGTGVERLSSLPLPPYDLWLPFKDGRCVPVSRATPVE